MLAQPSLVFKLPFVRETGLPELKSKPAQHSVKEMRSIGLFPQIIICRSDRKIDEAILTNSNDYTFLIHCK